MTQFLALILLVGSSAFATSRTVVDETFKTTFSDYNQLDKLLTCRPGFRGGYATGDTLILASHTIELGFSTDNKPFQADSLEALNKEPHSSPGKLRPFDDGCKPALEAFKKAVHASDRMEVTVHRTVTVYGETGTRVDRQVDGKMLHVEYFNRDLYYETFSVEIGGLQFTLGQSVNGVARKI